MAEKADIQSTYKSSDTEEWLDKVWTRPIGYRWALLFNHFDIHPNVITVISMVLGAASGFFFMSHADTTEGLIYNIIGVLLLAWANFYDSCDGQMARMTGKKTQLGRILDGAAGDVWFISIYTCIMIRLFNDPIPGLQELGITYPDGTPITFHLWFYALEFLAGIGCHGRQCGLSDYYRNIHMYFVKGNKGSELDNYRQQKQIYDSTPWKGNLLWKAFLLTYVNYTKTQEAQTPQFQRLLAKLKEKYGDNIPQEFRDEFRKNSLPLMKWANILTFNTRAIALYVSCLIDLPWLYPLFELTVLTALYFYMRHTHESFCKKMCDQL